MADFYNAFMNFRQNGLISKYFDYVIPQNYSILLIAACVVIAYLIGSVNFAVIISEKKYHEDIRNFGSGNGGMTNMARTYGRGAAIMTFVGDTMKALVAVTCGMALLGMYGGYCAGFFCIVGHCFPVFFRFRGGKGVATTAMTILCLSPLTFVILFTIFAIIVIGYKYISLGSVMGMLIYPVVLSMVEGPGFHCIVAILIAIVVIAKHKDNIRRLLNRTENKFEFKKHGSRDSDK